MKFFTYIVCFYLFALMALPSVRAMKMHFSEKCQSSCQKNNPETGEPSGCDKGKIIMNLSFTPVHYILSQIIFTNDKIAFNATVEKANSTYEKVFISQYKSSIWQPPKII